EMKAALGGGGGGKGKGGFGGGQGGDGGGPGGGGGFPGAGGGGGGWQGGAGTRLRIKMHSISADERTNKVFVAGPVDKISLAKQIINEMDRPLPGQEAKQFIGGP